MQVFRLSKYTPGKPSGKLDTQLFPECSGTDKDRDVVKKNRKRKQTTAARTKKLVGLEALRGNGNKVDKEEYDRAYSSAKFLYNQAKDSGWNDPESLFWATEQLIASLQHDLTSQGFSEQSAKLAAMSIVFTDTNRKQPTPQSQSVQPTAQPDSGSPNLPPVTEINNAIQAKQKGQIKTSQAEADSDDEAFNNGMKSIFGELPESAKDKNATRVEVIHPAIPEHSIPEKRFNVPLPKSAENRNINDILDYVWAYTNKLDGNDKNNRSSMVGDVFVVDGTGYVVLGSGFEKIPGNDIQKWLGVPKKWMALDKNSLLEMMATMGKTASEGTKKTNFKKPTCEDCKI